MLQIEGQQTGVVLTLIWVAVNRFAVALVQTVHGSCFSIFPIVGTGRQTIAHQLAVAIEKRHIPVGVSLRATCFDKNVLQAAFGVITPTLFVECAGRHKTVPTVFGFAAMCQIHFQATIAPQRQTQFIALGAQA